MNILHWESLLFKEIINALIKALGESLFVKLSVHELMWGYKFTVFAEINKLAKYFNISFRAPEMFGLFYNVCFLCCVEDEDNLNVFMLLLVSFGEHMLLGSFHSREFTVVDSGSIYLHYHQHVETGTSVLYY